MRNRSQSSGDLIADRRAAYAEALAEAGDFAAAADIMRQVLEIVPGWLGGLSLLAGYLERAGDIEGAIDAWRELASLDTGGIFGAALKLMAYEEASAIRTTDAAFVSALFDDYAGRFEAQLVLKLRYAVPEQLGALVTGEMERRGAERLAHAVDLGCGTGLMGERLRRHVSFLEGVDLSGGMIAESTRKGIYDALARDELTAFLDAHRGGIDLLAAADVLNYCGALDPILAVAARVLVPGGLFAFSLEAHEGPEATLLRPSLRYAHEPEAARGALLAAGLEILRFEQSVLRYDRGEPVVGYVVLAAKPAPLPVPAAADVLGDEPAPPPEILTIH